MRNVLAWIGVSALGAVLLGVVAVTALHPESTAGPLGSGGMTMALVLLAILAVGGALYIRWKEQAVPRAHAGDVCHKCGRKPNLTSAFCFFCGERYRKAESAPPAP